MKSKLFSLFTCICMLFACSNKSPKQADNSKLFLLVGTYTSGSSVGIYVYELDTITGETSYVSETKVSNPSFLAVSKDEKYIYAVSEDEGDNAKVHAYAFDKSTGQLIHLNEQQTKGDHPCYVNVDATNKFVVTANYTGGNISVFPLSDDGTLMPASQVKGFSSSVLAKFDTPSHLHSVVFSPDQKYAFAADLGKDKIYPFAVHLNPEDGLFLQARKTFSFDLEPGSGPRHIAFHPNGKYVYVINELSGKVTAFSYDDGIMNPIQYIASDTTSSTKKKGSADIHLSPDGKFLYSSNRLQSDGIAIFSVDKNTGLLNFIGYQATGIHPRNFTITPNGRFLLVANRDSNNIQIFNIDKQTGLLHYLGKEIQLNKPVYLNFIKK